MTTVASGRCTSAPADVARAIGIKLILKKSKNGKVNFLRYLEVVMHHLSTSHSNKISYSALTIAALLSAMLLIKTIPSGVRVIGVIDGYTLVLEGKEKVRLRYADDPELVFCGGPEAKATLEELEFGR